MDRTGLHLTLCEEAYPSDKDGRRYSGRQANPLACAECESSCLYGIELLKRIDEQQFRDLMCGADCRYCRQPCNLHRVAMMRKITWVRKPEKRSKSWLDIALRPYMEKRRNKP